MAFKKGSKEAKAHMAKVRASKISGVKKKVSKNQLSIFDIAPAKKKVTKKKVAPKKVVAKKKVVKQKGTSNKKYDKMRQALPPGVRISKVTGRPYKEVRANRSDKGVLLGINEDFFDTTVIKDIDDLRKQYFKLAQKYHPDKGGTTSQMQQLNAEHKKLLDKLLRGSKLSQEDQKNEIDIDDAMKVIIDNIITIQNINIEVVGKWLWVSSDTQGFTTPTYNALKLAGLKYIKKQGRPYMIYAGVQSTSRGKMSKSDIDAKYGKTTFTPKKPSSINGVITNKTKLLSALRKLKKALDNRPV
jgi:hypothetical protein